MFWKGLQVFESLYFGLKGLLFLMQPVLQLFYVMNKAIQLPLSIHFRLPPQGQFIHAFIDCNIPEHRLYTPESFAVLPSPHWAVYFDLHFVDVAEFFT